MKAHLMFPDRDFVVDDRAPWNAEALETDLALPALLEAMARGDGLIHAVARASILAAPGADIETIRYRQDILRDCLAHPALLRELYAITAEADDGEAAGGRSSLARYPDWVLRTSIGTIETMLGTLERLRDVTLRHRDALKSRGLGDLAATLERDVGADYATRARAHLKGMRFRDGILIGAELGPGNKGSAYWLLPPPAAGPARIVLPDWIERLIDRLTGRVRDQNVFSLDPRDEGGVQALESLRNRGVALAAGAVGEAAEHMRAFLRRLRAELAFYVGAVNLHERLSGLGVPLCIPEPAPNDDSRLTASELCDPTLALTLALKSGHGVVGNDIAADARRLVFVTGANQGGKSTFLRALGLAQLMMQAGLFVAGRAFRSSLVDGLATHFRREEDAAMESGKFDEELGRMSAIVDHVSPRMMILFNESFAATNEREGSEVARQVIGALHDRGTRMVCVTHLYELTQGFLDRREDDVLFLRAERREDGARSFRIVEGEPLRTSFGEDLYVEVFGLAPR